MSIQRLHLSKRYCEAVIHQETVYLSGQVPEKTVNLPAYEQTQEVLELIDNLLREAGTHKDNILTAQIFLADMADYDAMNRAWDEWVARDNAPCRATVEARLADPRWKVEIVITAKV